MTKTIPCGYHGTSIVYAIVDDEDFDRLKVHSWRIIVRKDKVTGIQRSLPRTGPNREGSIFIHHDVIGCPPTGLVTDHIDRNPLNNTKANLRFVTQRKNTQNNGINRGSVRNSGNRFQATVSKNFLTREEGQAWVRKIHGFIEEGIL